MAPSRDQVDASRKKRAWSPSTPRIRAKFSDSSSWSSTLTPANAAMSSSRSAIKGASRRML